MASDRPADASDLSAGASNREVLADITARLPGGGEDRPGQLDMADAVGNAIESDRHLVVEAGTGTGKSLAYLVPTVRSGRTAVVATATKALQDQLAGKDGPFLAEHLDEPVVVSVLKGRSNYLCRQRLAEMNDLESSTGDAGLLGNDGDESPAPTGLGAEIARIVEWSGRTATGDRAELDDEPSERAWATVSVTPRECPGAHRCPSGDTCFAEDARHAAAASQVIIVNTHLYGVHVASGGMVLPPHDVVVFDEAHQLEDIMSASTAVSITPGRIIAAARTARPLVADASVADDLESSGSRLTDELIALVDERLDGDVPERLARLLELTRSRAERLGAALAEKRDDDMDAPRLRARIVIDGLREDLDLALATPATHTSWVSGPAVTPSLQVALVDTAELLSDRLWSTVTGILTSATIPPGLAERAGLPADETDHLDVGSPFDYASQGLLYCPLHLPDRRSPDHEEAMLDELVALIEAAGGRTMALFTSWRAMQTAAEAVRGRIDHPVLAQGDLSKGALVERFTDEPESCLFATLGFWQGVDVPGPSLQLVTLDRIPFPRPDDPLLGARRDRAGRDGFSAVDLPRAATLLAQGAGRLIRSRDDRGVVAVFDTRLGRARYRWDLINALPPFKRTKERDEVIAFLQSLVPTTMSEAG